MGFGLLDYRTGNLGDEIQSLAARRFLPGVDVLLDRDDLTAAPLAPVSAILNGWFLHEPVRWPPHPAIRALPISMHLDGRKSRRWPWRRSIAERMLSRDGRAWFAAHGPVGARDAATLTLLRRHGIEAWYSGCLTLTLRRPAMKQRGGVIACDLPANAVVALRGRTDSPVNEVTHHHDGVLDHEARMALAEGLLDAYAAARCVVTSRLHCALPCLALGTPVLFLPLAPDQARLQPGIELCRTAGLDDLLAGRDGFDLDAPPPNPERWRPLAEALEARCAAFVAAS